MTFQSVTVMARAFSREAQRFWVENSSSTGKTAPRYGCWKVISFASSVGASLLSGTEYIVISIRGILVSLSSELGWLHALYWFLDINRPRFVLKQNRPKDSSIVFQNSEIENKIRPNDSWNKGALLSCMCSKVRRPWFWCRRYINIPNPIHSPDSEHDLVLIQRNTLNRATMEARK